MNLEKGEQNINTVNSKWCEIQILNKEVIFLLSLKIDKIQMNDKKNHILKIANFKVIENKD